MSGDVRKPKAYQNLCKDLVIFMTHNTKSKKNAKNYFCCILRIVVKKYTHNNGYIRFELETYVKTKWLQI